MTPADAAKLALAVGLTAGLSADIVYSCHLVQSSCRRSAAHRGHTNAVVVDVLGRLGAVESAVDALKAGRGDGH